MGYDTLLRQFSELDVAVARKRSAIAAPVRQLLPDERLLREQSAEVRHYAGGSNALNGRA